MNEIIREIEAAQLKAEVPAFETGDKKELQRRRR